MKILSRLSGITWRIVTCGALWGVLTLWLSPPIVAQELEINRWNHLPIDQNFVTANYARTQGEIAFDPVLRIEGATVEMDTWLLGYLRTFELFERTARVEIRQAWQEGTWNGLINGTQTSATREGLSDTFVKFAGNLIGAPPLAGKAYADYRAATDVETIVGVALGVQLPTGDYMEDKLINLGSNRFTFRPQLGLNQKYHNWSFEITGMASIFTDNTSFFNGNQLAQDPIYSIDGSVIYTFKSGIWASASAGIGVGGQSTVSGVDKDDHREDVGWAVSAGFPVTRSLGFKATYLELDHWEKVGTASRTMSVGLVGTWRDMVSMQMRQLVTTIRLNIEPARVKSVSELLGVRHEPHCWPLHGFRNRLSVPEIVLVALEERRHIFGRHQPGVMAKRDQTASFSACSAALCRSCAAAFSAWASAMRIITSDALGRIFSTFAVMPRGHAELLL